MVTAMYTKRFQSTPSWRGRHNGFKWDNMSGSISIHALVKRATTGKTWNGNGKRYFNPRPREEGDKYFLSGYLCPDNFNPRPREEGDRWASSFDADLPNFNPRPREEGDQRSLQGVHRYLISIHALVKRATPNCGFVLIDKLISIHALVKRATFFIGIGQKKHGISIHALVKRATAYEYTLPRAIKISIHALVKRATRRKGTYTCTQGHFNPRPREEGDLIHILSKLLQTYFNPRPHEEGDLFSRYGSKKDISFQSTPSWRGRLVYTYSKGVVPSISIHALMKRATKNYLFWNIFRIFQSTPSWRGRHYTP